MSNETAPSQEVIVEVKGLSRTFGSTVALDQVDLEVTRGGVFGVVGENGAGKTTLMKHLMGLYKAKTGSVRLFGMDPVKNPEEVLVKIGYLSEDRDMPRWMKVHQLLRYTRAFYPNWDPDYAEELREWFELDPKAKLRNLSRGQLAKAGLLIALAHRPELLILDEPSSGLDPIVRKEILQAIVRTVADEGRTVIFSSHLLDEVERVADRVAMIYHGKVVLNAPLEDVKAEHHRLVVRATNGTADFKTLQGVLTCHDSANESVIVAQGERASIQNAITSSGGEVLEIATPSLEEIFVAQAGKGKQK